MPSPGLWPAPTTMATRSFRRMSVDSIKRGADSILGYAARLLLGMDKTPADCADRAKPENGRGRRLNAETRAALVGRLRIAGHVQDAAGDPHNADGGCQRVAHIEREQPERRKEDRHP